MGTYLVDKVTGRPGSTVAVSLFAHGHGIQREALNLALPSTHSLSP